MNHPGGRLVGLTLLLGLLITGTVSAQRELYVYRGTPPEGFGGEVSRAGDVNNDGRDDFLITTDGDRSNGIRVDVYSGMDGGLLYLLNGSGWFGESISDLGDVNQDGHDDFIVGAPLDAGFFRGATYVYSGIDGTPLHSLIGKAGNDWFGAAVEAAGDVNNDGYPDLVVGASQIGSGGVGYASVYSGCDGSLIWEFDGDDPGDEFGSAVAGVGDLNQDGYAEVIVAAPEDDNGLSDSGMVRVFCGQTGAVMYERNGGFRDNFGAAVTGIGDLTGDGSPEFAVAAPGDYIRIFSGADGSVVRDITVPGASFLGRELSSGFDLNGDGLPELLSGDSGADLFDGATGRLLYTYQVVGASGSFGCCVALLGCVDGDGIPDVLVSTPRAIALGGKAVVYAGDDVFLNASPKTVAPGAGLTLTTGIATPGETMAVVWNEFDGQPIPPLLVSLNTLDANGQSILNTVVPTTPGLYGRTFGVYSLITRPGGGLRQTSMETLLIQ